MSGGPASRHAAERRRARRVGAVGFVLAAALPFVLWSEVIRDVMAEARIDVRFVLMEASPWLLMALGLVCFLWALIVEFRDRDRRFYRPGSGPWVGWGVTLYLLGFALATQVAQLHGLNAY